MTAQEVHSLFAVNINLDVCPTLNRAFCPADLRGKNKVFSEKRVSLSYAWFDGGYLNLVAGSLGYKPDT